MNTMRYLIEESKKKKILFEIKSRKKILKYFYWWKKIVFNDFNHISFQEILKHLKILIHFFRRRGRGGCAINFEVENAFIPTHIKYERVVILCIRTCPLRR